MATQPILLSSSVVETESDFTHSEDNINRLKIVLPSKELRHNVEDDTSSTKYKCFLGEFETQIKWPNVFLIFFWHAFAVYKFARHDFTDSLKIIIFASMWGYWAGFGISAGAHRLWTHRCYKAKTPLKVILLILYSMAGHNSLKDWVRDHRVHHKYSETDADPHNSKRGFFFAHVGWLLMKKHKEVIRRGKEIDISDLYEDPLIAFHIKYSIWFTFFFCFFLPSIIPPLWWGEPLSTSILANCFVRYVILLNMTWLVNSAAHMWGNRPYEKNLNPVENKWVSILSSGEGWHNYHHKFPWDYRAGELGRSFNVTLIFIDIFAMIGWAYDLKTTSNTIVKKTIETHGDGSHAIWGNLKK